MKKIIAIIGFIVSFFFMGYLLTYNKYDFFLNDNQGNGVKIAVLDSGYSNESINPCVHIVRLSGSSGEDNYGHGTNVIDIITSYVTKAEIYSLKVLDDEGVGDYERIISALDWCRVNDIDIVNMSFSTTNNSKEFKEKLRELHDLGIILVASFDNIRDVSYPAEYEYVIGVKSHGSKSISVCENCIYANGGDITNTPNINYNSYGAARVTAFIAQNIEDEKLMGRIMCE